MSENHTGNMQNEIIREEHEGEINAKRTILAPLSYYRNASLASGYVFHGFCLPGTQPNTSFFRIQREDLDTGGFLFAAGDPKFHHQWSASSLASISYL